MHRQFYHFEEDGQKNKNSMSGTVKDKIREWEKKGAQLRKDFQSGKATPMAFMLVEGRRP